MKKLAFVLFTIILTITSNAQSGLHVANTFHIASTGGWDYLEVGPVTIGCT
ncbi:MAG: hypothetical protein WDM90_02895 [Ferruginibacter sp.]